MDEQKQQRILRIVVFSMLIIGALGFLLYFAQGGEIAGDNGIFQFFQAPADPTVQPGGAPVGE